MSTVLMVLLILNAFILLVLIIVFQQGNEGGLGGALGGGNTTGFFGASGGVGFIVKATWVAGVTFFCLALGTAWYKTYERYELKQELDRALSAPAATQPVVPQPQPRALPETPTN